jgi:hypothetical protein
MSWDPENPRCPRCGVETIREGARERFEAEINGAEILTRMWPDGPTVSPGPLHGVVCRRCGCVELLAMNFKALS